MKREPENRICSCGKPLPMPKDGTVFAEFQCPHCGKRIVSDDEAGPVFSASETQMINIQDMARMAQDGVDVGISGEWDTSEPLPDKRKKDG